MSLHLESRGIPETRRKLAQVASNLSGQPLVDAVSSAARVVQSDARTFAPVDTGRLRGSIAQTVSREGLTVRGVIGSDLAYAPAVEHGAPPHPVSVAALEGWAARHGLNAYAVARTISRRGTPARRFLSHAFEQNRARAIQIIALAVEKVVKR